ncbi:MAG: hypothetical protein KAS74_03110 [Methanosarcinales archaeon]|nr:hypothetical protein [Methanosarcinales archaeon]
MRSYDLAGGGWAHRGRLNLRHLVKRGIDMGEVENATDLYMAMLSSVVNTTIDANEKLGKLAQRLGRLIPKFTRVDHSKTGMFTWVREYRSIKESVNKANQDYQSSFRTIITLMQEQKFNPDNTFWMASNIYHSQYPRYKAKIEILDDVLLAMWEDVIDDIEFEETQKSKMKEEIEKTIDKSKIDQMMYR